MNILNRTSARRAWRGMNATRIVALSFSGVIVIGALLLLLPGMTRSGEGAGVLTSLFTATSATCVTGLTLEDTVSFWSLGGQVVILVMIQLGGLGFITAYTLLMAVVQKRLDLSQRMLLASALNLNSIGGVARLVRHAILGTLLLEGVGTAALAFRFVPLYGFWRGLWHSLFHAVSAFCNAGFDLTGEKGGVSSLGQFSQDSYVLLVHGVLIVVGGLGFVVWEDLLSNCSWKKLSLYSKMVLVTTGVLLAAGLCYFLLAEWSNPATLGALTGGDRVTNALFQSITLRTAGFASFAQDGLRESSQVVSILFMLIGGSSGSTAGGIKTVTAAVLALALWGGLHGKQEVILRGRSIPRRQVNNAMTLTLTVVFLVFVASVAISLLEGSGYLAILFEVASAIGTVGLSTGLTGSLSLASSLLVIFLMYMGRVGILSFSLAFLTGKHTAAKVKYPTFDIMVG